MGLVARWRVLHNMAGVGLSIVVTSIVWRDWWGKVSAGARSAPGINTAIITVEDKEDGD